MPIKCHLVVLLISLSFVSCNTDVVAQACKRNPMLPYCKNEERKAPEHWDVPSNPFESETSTRFTVDPNFKAKFEPESDEAELKILNPDYTLSEEESISGYGRGIYETTESPTPPIVTSPFPPFRPNVLYTVFPNLQPKNTPHYCPQNQYKFQLTCRPSRKLRYDLRLFCQDYADFCGVPNINLYPSRSDPADDGRPNGYGQKQKNGQIGLGKSFSVGLGILPGFEVVGSQGFDIGPMPGVDQMGGLIVNSGQDIGLLGQRIGKGPARAMKSLLRGFPVYSDPRGDLIDKKAQDKALRSLGIPPQLGGALSFLTPTTPKRGKKRIGYEPGYGAVNRKSLLATGKTDDDSVIVPGMGEIELVKGIGLGIG